jgi:uncharacterized membrane protein YozB (DUF420 family)
MAPTHLVSTLVLVLIGVALYRRHNPKLHATLMRVAFLIDLGLVLYLELTRQAVETAIAGGAGWLLPFHVTVSVLAALGWAAQLWLGLRLLRGDTVLRVRHIQVGVFFLVMRLANYITSFFVASSV